MEESTKIILGAIVSFTILVIGVILKYTFSRKEEYLRKKEELKIQAYSDFIRSVSIMGIKSKTNSQDSETYSSLLDAKNRLSIYGSTEVIKAIAELWRTGPVFDSPEKINKYVQIIQLMRKENFKSKTTVDANDISQLIFSMDVKEELKQ